MMPEQELSMGVTAEAEDKRVAREEPEEDECYVRRQAEDLGQVCRSMPLLAF